MQDRHGGVAACAALVGIAIAWAALGGAPDTGPAVGEPPLPRRHVALERAVESATPARQLMAEQLVPSRTPTDLAQDDEVEIPEDAVFCETTVLGGTLEDGTSVSLELFALDPADWAEVVVAHDGLWVDASLPRGAARITVEGYLPASLDWWNGTCRPVFLERSVAEVAGEVLDPDGWPVPGAWVRCPSGEVPADEDGRFACELPNRAVELSARRVEGLLTVLSEPVSVAAGAVSRDVVLRLPSGPRGGIGATLVPAMPGVTFGRIVPGSPAEEAGLEAGDTIVAVDGEALLSGSADIAVRRIVGEVGTPVELLVRDVLGTERRVVLERREITSAPLPVTID